MRAATLAQIIAAATLAACSSGAVGDSDPSAAQGNLGSGTTVSIGGHAMAVSSVDAWLPYQYDNTAGYYQLFIKFHGGDYTDGTDIAINVSDRGIGCHDDPTTGAAQQVWLRPNDDNEYISNDGDYCGLTVSSIPADNGHLTGTFKGAMSELNGARVTADIEVHFDVPVMSAQVSIGGTPMHVTTTDLWLPRSADPDANYYQGFVRFNGPGFPEGTDLALDLSSTGSVCVAAPDPSQNTVWLRPDQGADQFIPYDRGDCGLTVGVLADGRAAGVFSGDLHGLNGTGVAHDVRLVFDIARR